MDSGKDSANGSKGSKKIILIDFMLFYDRNIDFVLEVPFIESATFLARVLPHLLRRSPLPEGAFRGKKPDLKAPSERELSRSD